MSLQQGLLRSATLAVVAILYVSYGLSLGTALATVCVVQAAGLLFVVVASPPGKKPIPRDWLDVAGQDLLDTCTNMKSFVQRFSVQDVTFVVLSFLCVKAVARFGLVPWPAVGLLGLLAGTFYSVFSG